MNKLKLPDKGKKEITAGEKTAQEFINVQDIDGQILTTKDGYAFGYINVSPFCRELMTEKEQFIKGQALINQLKAINKPFKVLKLQMPIDVSAHIQHYASMKNFDNMSSPKNRIIDANIAKLDQIATSNKSVSFLYYICIWEPSNQSGKLPERLHELKNIFENAGMEAAICTGMDILQLCNLFTNPVSFSEQLSVGKSLVTLVKEVMYENEEN